MKKTIGYSILWTYLFMALIGAVFAVLTNDLAMLMCSILIILVAMYMILAGKYDFMYLVMDLYPHDTMFQMVSKFHGPYSNSIDTGEGIVATPIFGGTTPAKYLWRWTIYQGESGLTVYRDNASGLFTNGWYYSKPT